MNLREEDKEMWGGSMQDIVEVASTPKTFTQFGGPKKLLQTALTTWMFCILHLLFGP